MIWLLRHGDAEEGSPDAARPLTPKGERQARDAGLALVRLSVSIDSCLTSPRVRAADTAKLACAALGIAPEVEERLAGGAFDPEELADGETLLVGHEPDFSDAVRRVTGARVQLKKGGVAAVEAGELQLLLRPAELSAIAAGAPH